MMDLEQHMRISEGGRSVCLGRYNSFFHSSDKKLSLRSNHSLEGTKTIHRDGKAKGVVVGCIKDAFCEDPLMIMPQQIMSNPS